MPPSPEQASSGQQSPREPQVPAASHAPESDKRDNIADPDHADEAPAIDEDKGHDQSTAHVQLAADAELAAPAAPAERAADTEPATEVFPAVVLATDTEPATEVFPAVVLAEYTEPEYTEPEYTEPEYTEPEYTEPEYTEPEDTASPEDAAPPEDKAPPKAAPPNPAAPHVRVDGRLLEAALLNLRKRIAAIPLVFEISGAAEVKIERTKLLSQIDDYLLPRVRRSAAPILVALVGSTGAGKSTLVNSIVGSPVSATGVRRPTTNSPVLACHPDEIDWFAENNFLPTLPRVRQEGLARPGRDGLLVLAASEGMPRGIALLDTPDIDSVVQAHHEFAYQFLDASDLWLFMTSASRYADGPVWEILQHARERKAALGVVMSRVPQAYRTELVSHFAAMLDANGMSGADRFVIPEIPLIDGMLPPDAYQPIRDWLADTAARSDRRVAVLSQTMSGVLDTFKTRVPAIAAHVEAQVLLRAELRRAAETAYQAAFAQTGTGMKNGELLRGELLARWEDCVVGGELRPRRGAKGTKAAKGGTRKGKRARRGPSRPAALNTSVRSAVESFIVSVADRAAEQVHGKWRSDPAGAVLLAAAAAERARDTRAKQVFESVFGPGGRSGNGGPAAADIKAADTITAADAAQAAAFSRSSPDLAFRAARAVGAWQDHLTRMTDAEDPQSAARRISFDDEALSLVVLLAMLGEDAPGAASPADGSEGASIYAEPRRMLASVYGEQVLPPILAKARADLLERVRLLLDEELVRFIEVLDAAGPCDDAAAVRVYQAEFSLEAVR